MQKKYRGDEGRRGRGGTEGDVCVLLSQEERNAAHFQLINTADRACWRKPHYAAGC